MKSFILPTFRGLLEGEEALMTEFGWIQEKKSSFSCGTVLCLAAYLRDAEHTYIFHLIEKGWDS